jgi:hypothetical protein
MQHQEKTQWNILQKYITANKSTLFGQQHHFDQIKTYSDYQKSVPIISDYGEISHYIEKMANGSQNILSTDPVLFFETTSGSTSLPKLIPYNQTLKDEFQKGVAVWMHELKKQFPQALSGRSYWSLSPPLKERSVTAAGIPVGTKADDEYFNPVSRYLINKMMAVDKSVLMFSIKEQFYLETCVQLLEKEDLSFVSVWSPGFFLLIDDFIRTHYDEIILKIQNNKRRKSLLLLDDFCWEKAFPHLAVISCWTEAQAAIWLPQMRARTGNIAIQPKGLLSTEGMVTVPMSFGNALAYTCHFFEFIHVGNHLIYLSHELTLFESYEVVITTGGGLYRYKTRDIVQVVGLTPCPVFKFIGRSGVVSDLVGEKVDMLAVQEIFNTILKRCHGINALLLQPQKSEMTAYYQLFIFSDQNLDIESVVRKVNAQLHQNPYYHQAVSLGQLGDLKAKLYPNTSLNRFADKYARHNSIKDGDAKLPVLLPVHINFEI